MAEILGIPQGVNKANGVLALALFDRNEELIRQMGKILSLADPVFVSLNVELGRETGKMNEKLFLGKLPILGYIQDGLESLVHGSF